MYTIASVLVRSCSNIETPSSLTDEGKVESVTPDNGSLFNSVRSS
jgi:hypothetical protein